MYSFLVDSQFIPSFSWEGLDMKVIKWEWSWSFSVFLCPPLSGGSVVVLLLWVADLDCPDVLSRAGVCLARLLLFCPLLATVWG